MGKGAALRWIENHMMARHLRGRGVEIGALWRKFPVPSGAKTWYLDRIEPDELREDYPEVRANLIPPDLVGEAAELPFQDGSLDFIIASHVEHMTFPLATLRNWYRVLAADGALVLRIPDKRYTFDVRRPRTALQHLIEEDANPSAFDKRAHFAEWVEHVVGRKRGTEPWEHETNRLMEIDYSIHYHAWTDEDVLELLNYTCSRMKLDWGPVLFLPARFYRKECAVVMRKG